MSDALPVITPLPPAASCVLSAAVALRAENGSLPGRVKILNWGENLGRTTKARIVVGPVSLSRLPAFQEATASDTIGLDFEHQSVPSHPNYRPDPRDMAGHAKVEIVDGDGVYLSGIGYTPAGNRYAANYPDISAHVFLDKDGNLLFVRSAALTQHGDVAGMEFAESVAACALCPSLSATIPPTPPMDTNTPDPVTTDYRALLITMLGIAPAEGESEVTDEQIAAAVAAQAATPSDPQEPAMEAALAARMDAFERRQIMFEASLAGKVIPLDETALAALPTASLSALVAGLAPGQVPTGPSAASHEKPAATEAALSADQTAAARALGLTPEEYRAALT